MAYKITFTLTADDYLNFNKDHLLKSPKTIIFEVAFLVVVAGMFIFDIIKTHNVLQALVNNSIFFLCILIWIISFLVFFPIRIKRIYKKDPLMQMEHTYTLNEDSITEENERGTTTYLVSDFQKVFVSKRMIQIYVASNKALVIPRRIFENSDKEQEIVDFINSNYVKGND